MALGPDIQDGETYSWERDLLPRFKNHPDFHPTADAYAGEMDMAYFAEQVEAGTIEPPLLDEGIEELKSRVRKMHPLLPLLAGEVQLENPKLQIPLVFKWVDPSIKSLNDRFGPSAVNALMESIQSAIRRIFGTSEAGKLPILSLLGTDFKTGKAILNLNSPALGEGDPWEAFVKQTELFQEEINRILAVFFQSKEVDMHEWPVARMVFGVTDWSLAPDPEKLEVSDYNQGLLLAEHVANMTQRRVRKGDVGLPRKSCVRLSPDKYFKYFLSDFRWAHQTFFALYSTKINDPVWQGIFTEYQGVPFLDPVALQALRKGTFEMDYPFVSFQDREILNRFYRVINTIDVLKPFLGVRVEQFFQRLTQMKDHLMEGPLGQDEKKSHFLTLFNEAVESMKSRGEVEVAMTRLGTAAHLRKVLSGDEATVLLFTDVIAFSEKNIFALYLDALAIMPQWDTAETNYRPDQLRHLVHSAGDQATVHLHQGQEEMPDIFGTGTRVDVSGGDETLAFVPFTTWEDLLLRYDRLMQVLPVRTLAVELPTQTELDATQAGELMATLTLMAERCFEQLKKAPSTHPVKVKLTA